LTAEPSTADSAAHMGVDALVPPTVHQPDDPEYGVLS
jgi:hypothetical protein